MAKYTRTEIRRILGDAHTDDMENQLIALYLGAVDPLKDELAKAKADAEKLTTVQKELDDLKAKGDDGWKDKHDTIKKEFEEYKAGITAKETKEAKEKAVRAYFESKNIEGANLNLAMRSSRAEIEALEMDGEKIKDTAALDALIAGDFASLVTTTEVKGAPTATPPAGAGAGAADLGSLSMEDYIAARKKK